MIESQNKRKTENGEGVLRKKVETEGREQQTGKGGKCWSAPYRPADVRLQRHTFAPCVIVMHCPCKLKHYTMIT